MNEELWNLDQVADFLNFSKSHTRDRIVSHPAFPKRIRMPTSDGGKTQARWRADEVRKYIERHKQ